MHKTITKTNGYTDYEARWSVTRNSCKLCAPLGASLVFAGLERSIHLLHGSQGCATYIRRYLISHFREPLDIASSSFTEETAVFGGKNNLLTALDNLVKQYQPALIGVTSTCLAETMGEDTNAWLTSWYERQLAEKGTAPYTVNVSAPSYEASHREGFQKALTALIRYFCCLDHEYKDTPPQKKVVILSGMLSPADQRWLKRIMALYDLPFTLVPDYAQTLDGGPWTEYRLLQAGGTAMADLKAIKNCLAVIELGALPGLGKTGGELLAEASGAPLFSLPLPLGLKNTDLFLEAVSELAGQPVPAEESETRERLLDAYIDGHKYVFGIKTVLYGEEDFVAGLAAFLQETGLSPILCATGGQAVYLEQTISAKPAGAGTGSSSASGEPDKAPPLLMRKADFAGMAEALQEQPVELMIGNSKGYKLAKEKDIPLIRVGFPIHDRFGGARLLHLGYEGALQLYDRIVNALIARRQREDPTGYTYY
jgi:nitrogenase molybdenum-iron protein NifN